MSSTLLLSLNQKSAKTPYTFVKSRVNIYSLEEALFYTHKNWKERDFCSPAFIAWVDTILELSDISDRLQELNKMDSYADKLMGFLSITPYFEPNKLTAVKTEAMAWEEQNGATILKEEADTQVHIAPKTATDLYKRAIAKGDNAQTYNNMAISYMNRNMYKEAVQTFSTAYNLDKTNLDILLNYSLALIEVGEIEQAFRYIRRAEAIEETSYVYYLYAKICHANGNIEEAIPYLEQALSMEKNSEYYYFLATLYMFAESGDLAIKTINKIKQKDQKYYTKLAEIFAIMGDYSKAIQAMEDGHKKGYKTADTLAVLASYHRQNFDLKNAKITVQEALALEPNKLALMEDAKIKKSKGNLRDYQKIMENILKEAKENYRKKI